MSATVRIHKWLIKDAGITYEKLGPDSAEGHDFRPVDKPDYLMADGEKSESEPTFDLSYATLFATYRAAVSARSQPDPIPDPAQSTNHATSGFNVPHCVPTVVDYPENKNAGQPIRMNPQGSPQDHVTGRLADDACFQMADFVNSTGMTSSQRDAFFKLELNTHLPWQNDREFMADIDALPRGPPMHEYRVSFGEGGAETAEFRSKNVLEVLQQLISDPCFREHLDYVPRRYWTDDSRKVRIYDEASSGKWWWRMQCLIKDEFGTVLPVILMSDKTKLTSMSGGKEAWPIYITIGNIHKQVRRQPSKRAVVLLGYLPIPKTLLDENDEAIQGAHAWEVFHKCMKIILDPLIEASSKGIKMWCSDGGVRRCYPFVSAYVADYPEQCLVACTSRCPVCEQGTEGWSDLGEPAPLRTKRTTLQALEEAEVRKMKNANTLGLRTVWPFWTYHEHVNLAAAITPDLLHQLHKGMFLDHLVKWCKELMGEDVMDERFMAMTRYKGTQHFANGISAVSQWTGREAKEMARVFLAVIDGAVPTKAMTAARALLNFMFTAHSPSLSDIELKDMDRWLAVFHENKDVFGKKPDGTNRNFGLIRKLHMLRHYTYSSSELGTPDGYNTETAELLHISLTKNPYRASNKNEPMEQMATNLQRRDSVVQRRYYLQQRDRLHLVLSRSQAGTAGDEANDYIDSDAEEHIGDESNRERDVNVEDKGREYGKGEAGDHQRDRGEDESGSQGIKCLVVGANKTTIGATWVRRKLTRPFGPRPKYFQSKHCSGPLQLGATLVDAHDASDLIVAFNLFLDKVAPSSSPHPRILDTHFFPSWSQCMLRYPRLPFKPSEPPMVSVVRATPARFKRGRQTCAAAFDTVLVPWDTNQTGLLQYRPARVRAFLRLPSHLRHFYPHTVVYLELFTPFQLDSSSGFYRTLPAVMHGQRQVVVAPLTTIRMSCQLAPNFSTIPDGVVLNASLDALDVCSEFSFNPFADYFLFNVMQHWEACARSACLPRDAPATVWYVRHYAYTMPY